MFKKVQTIILAFALLGCSYNPVSIKKTTNTYNEQIKAHFNVCRNRCKYYVAK